METLSDLLAELPAAERERLVAQVSTQVGEARLASALDAATATYRADPSEENRAAYRAANEALYTHRSQAREGRTGVGVGGDAVVS